MTLVSSSTRSTQQNQTTVKTLEGLNANSINIQNTPAKKVHVGDIDIRTRCLAKATL